MATVILNGPALGGRQAQQLIQQGVNLQTTFDVQGMAVHRAAISKGETPYVGDSARVFDTVPYQVLLRFKDLMSADLFGSPHVLPCVNGCGSDLVNSGMSDEEIRLRVLSETEFAGISLVGASSAEHSTGMTSQIRGTIKVMAATNIAPGQLVKYSIPTPTEARSRRFKNINARMGAPEDKAMPVIIGADNTSIAVRYATYRDRALADSKKFDEVFSNSSSISKALRAQFQSQLSAVVLALYQLLGDVGNWNLISANGTVGPVAKKPAIDTRANALELCNRLAVGFGLAKDNQNTVRLTQAEMREFEHLRQKVLNAINWTGLLNTGYGETPLARHGERLEVFAPEPRDNASIALQMSTHAYNGGKREVSVYPAFVEEEQRQTIGVGTNGAVAGELAEILLFG
jgi:hypothetical protein